MSDYPNEERVVEEWGMMLDCSEHPDDRHSDEYLVVNWSQRPEGWPVRPDAPVGKINNHRAVRVKRTVTYTKWEQA